MGLTKSQIYHLEHNCGYKYDPVEKGWTKPFDKIGLIVVDQQTGVILYKVQQDWYFSYLTLEGINSAIWHLQNELDAIFIKG